jgi:hypothetical protein
VKRIAVVFVAFMIALLVVAQPAFAWEKKHCNAGNGNGPEPPFGIQTGSPDCDPTAQSALRNADNTREGP